MELIIVIVVIGVLATIVTLSLIRYQQTGRDAQRTANATVIAESLEKYFSENGEYPSCADLSVDPDVVTTQTLPSIDVSAFRTPTASETHSTSLVCSDLAKGSTSDVFAFVGDGSTSCATAAGSCLSWTLKYREEASGEIATITSRHGQSVDTSGALALSVSLSSFVNADVSWNAVQNATGYHVQMSTSASFAAPTEATLTTTTRTFPGLTLETKYFFRVAAIASTGQSLWSPTKSVTPSIAAPGAPVIAATMVGDTARATVNQVTCVSGTTAQYQFRGRSSSTADSGTWGTYGAWSTVRTSDVTSTTQGTRYEFQANARCHASVGDSTSTTATAAVTTTVTSPSGGTIAVTLTTAPAARGTVTGTSCVAPASVQYAYRSLERNVTTTGWEDTWTSWGSGATHTVSGAAKQGYEYRIQAKARCQTSRAQSAEKDLGAGYTVRAISKPSAPAKPDDGIADGPTTANSITYTYDYTSCPSGTSASFERRWGMDDAKSASGTLITDWRTAVESTAKSYLVSTSYQGYSYSMGLRVACKTAFATSEFSNWSQADSHVRTIAKPYSATNFKVSLVDDRYWGPTDLGQVFRQVRVTWTAPTCGSSTTGIRWAEAAMVNALGGGAAIDIWSGTLPSATVSAERWFQSTFPISLVDWSKENGPGANPNTNDVAPSSVLIQKFRLETAGLSQEFAGGWAPVNATSLDKARALVVYACINDYTGRVGNFGSYAVSGILK